eukprot:CAMPEP_0182898504 /NCGR_PEP_ID=MMETSP0034_2-20130328/27522_1 /TAXON_ID=156128 /ORGANISM="Nephroselmis pyriformis, Strain CCMP717" /LENGTH=111 /DNA_ID=CAMNT_0025032477 /DNA_START=11 /DNA_END=346 /DNA_ORIENTATION=+
MGSSSGGSREDGAKATRTLRTQGSCDSTSRLSRNGSKNSTFQWEDVPEIPPVPAGFENFCAPGAWTRPAPGPAAPPDGRASLSRHDPNERTSLSRVRLSNGDRGDRGEGGG